jgi:predicted dehydrogenase
MRLLHYAVERVANRLRPRLRPAEPVKIASNKPSFGIVGLGTIGRQHAEALLCSSNATLAGIATRDLDKRKEFGRLCPNWFIDPVEMYDSGLVDAVIIATPHQNHANVAISAINRGLHVLCEKPLAVTAPEAREIYRAAHDAGVTLAIVHQHHASAGLQMIYKILNSNELGPVLRADLVETFPRDRTYYSEAPWRGTWAGEGGGSLVNQAIHAIDVCLWLFGEPTAVSAQTQTRFHEIETEDTVSISIQHLCSTVGTIFVSTAQCPPLFSLQILCEGGVISLVNGILRIGAVNGPTQSFVEGANPYSSPLALVHANFVAAIAGRHDPWVPGGKGVEAVEVMNAAYVASNSGKAETLPISDERFAEFSRSMIERENHAI